MSIKSYLASARTSDPALPTAANIASITQDKIGLSSKVAITYRWIRIGNTEIPLVLQIKHLKHKQDCQQQKEKKKQSTTIMCSMMNMSIKEGIYKQACNDPDFSVEVDVFDPQSQQEKHARVGHEQNESLDEKGSPQTTRRCII